MGGKVNGIPVSPLQQEGDKVALHDENIHAYKLWAAYGARALGDRYSFSRIPYACDPVACYLCGEGATSEEKLIEEHIKPCHLPTQTSLSNEASQQSIVNASSTTRISAGRRQ